MAKKKPSKKLKVFHVGDVADPHAYLLSPKDKVIGYLIRGKEKDDYMLFISTDNAALYFGGYQDVPFSKMFVWCPGTRNIWCGFEWGKEGIERSLEFIQKQHLNKFELNELFGHDGPSSGLVEYLSNLAKPKAKKPPKK